MKKVCFTVVNDAYDRCYYELLPSIRVRPRVQGLYTLKSVRVNFHVLKTALSKNLLQLNHFPLCSHYLMIIFNFFSATSPCSAASTASASKSLCTVI